MPPARLGFEESGIIGCAQFPLKEMKLIVIPLILQHWSHCLLISKETAMQPAGTG